MQEGDHVQLIALRNPHKGNISRGKTYEIERAMGEGHHRAIRIKMNNGTLVWVHARDFVVKYYSPRPAAPLDDDEYNQIIAAQDAFSNEKPDSLDLAKING